MWSQDTDVKANIITAITEDALRDARHGWAKMGFLSRFIIFSYSYHLSTVAMILRSYSYRGLTLQPLKVKLPRAKQIKVFLASALAEQLNPIAMKNWRAIPALRIPRQDQLPLPPQMPRLSTGTESRY